MEVSSPGNTITLRKWDYQFWEFLSSYTEIEMFFAQWLSSREALPLSKSKRDVLGVTKATYTLLTVRERKCSKLISFYLMLIFSVNHGSRVHPGRKDRHFKTTSFTQTVEGLSYTLWKLFNLLLFYRLIVEEFLASYLKDQLLMIVCIFQFSFVVYNYKLFCNRRVNLLWFVSGTRTHCSRHWRSRQFTQGDK